MHARSTTTEARVRSEYEASKREYERLRRATQEAPVPRRPHAPKTAASSRRRFYLLSRRDVGCFTVGDGSRSYVVTIGPDASCTCDTAACAHLEWVRSRSRGPVHVGGLNVGDPKLWHGTT